MMRSISCEAVALANAFINLHAETPLRERITKPQLLRLATCRFLVLRCSAHHWSTDDENLNQEVNETIGHLSTNGMPGRQYGFG